MMAGMVNGNPDIEDINKFYKALQRAQRDIDLRPELYTHYLPEGIACAIP